LKIFKLCCCRGYRGWSPWSSLTKKHFKRSDERGLCVCWLL